MNIIITLYNGQEITVSKVSKFEIDGSVMTVWIRGNVQPLTYSADKVICTEET